ncbi:MAG: pyridoxamine 5'-phosphate oxidase family protein, partial [Rhizobiaceae bacterium]
MKITSETQLDALYGEPVSTAILKEIDYISEDYARYILASPFLIMATSGPEGLDCSPRGDPAGFARIADPKTLMIPDRRGNNRIDSLRNIVRDPRVGLLFLIPGIGITMRVNGRAELSTDPELCASFLMEGKAPKCVIIVHVERAYTQCKKALVRSKLWDASAFISVDQLPTIGEMMERLSPGEFDGKAYDAAYPERMKQTIY